jgi:hypothetical protein
MGFMNLSSKDRPTILVGKTGTGKTTKAKEMCPDANIYYANELPYLDINSLSNNKGLIIEEIHIKPDKEQILSLITQYDGKLVMTSMNKKDVPKEIINMCNVKLIGKKNYMRENIKSFAPRSIEPYVLHDEMFGIVQDYLRETNRDKIAYKLKVNKPADTQIMSWLVENIHPNKLIYIDAKVRRKLSSNYFYEMLAYSHTGSNFNKVRFPKRGTYSPIPKLCRRLKLKSHEGFVLKELIKNEDFANYAKTRLDNSECRILGLGEKKRKKKTDKVIADRNTNLMEWL